MNRILQYNVARGERMATFQIPKIPQTTSKSIRFPDEIIARVEDAIKSTDCTFSAFVIEATRVALDNTEAVGAEIGHSGGELAQCYS